MKRISKGEAAESAGDQRSPPIIVVGIDPGLANLGLGAVEEQGKRWRLLGSKLVHTKNREEQAARLQALFQATSTFLLQYRPHAVAIESQYFHQQRATAFKVGQAFGVCLLATRELQLPVCEYGPMQVKQALVGNGRASKEQVNYMVRALLNLKGAPESHHVSDAIAMALTHLSFRRLGAVREG